MFKYNIIEPCLWYRYSELQNKSRTEKMTLSVHDKVQYSSPLIAALSEIHIHEMYELKSPIGADNLLMYALYLKVFYSIFLFYFIFFVLCKHSATMHVI